MDQEEDLGVGMTVEEKVDFKDIASRPSSVQIEVSPAVFFDCVSCWIAKDSYEPIEMPLLKKVVLDDDMEAFLVIEKLYEQVGAHFKTDALEYAIQQDRPDMLDEIIRRHGAYLSHRFDNLEESKPPERSAYKGLKTWKRKRPQNQGQDFIVGRYASLMTSASIH